MTESFPSCSAQTSPTFANVYRAVRLLEKNQLLIGRSGNCKDASLREERKSGILTAKKFPSQKYAQKIKVMSWTSFPGQLREKVDSIEF
jgi:hypothetical protein